MSYVQTYVRMGRAAEMRKQDATEKFATVPSTAELLRVSHKTVRRWILRKKLVAHYFGGATRLASDDVVHFITRARRGPTPLHPVNPLNEKFYTAEDVVEILNVCMRTVRRHIKSECLASHKFGRIVRIAGSDLQDFIDRSRGE